MTVARDAPAVSIVLPTLNERAYLKDCLDSLVAQSYPAIDEVLVVDGGSSDGTVELAQKMGAPIRVVDNPRVTAAAAMNVGLAAARNDLIVRADAHTLYEPDYVERSVLAWQTSGADWVGGPMRAIGTTSFGRAVAAVTSSPFGVGPGRFHYATEATDVETVYLGTFDRRIVDEVGGYDETTLQWAAEDQELAYRLRLAGRRIRLDPSIRSWYFPRQTPSALWRQYLNYGVCKASTLKKHRTLPYWRPVVPAAMVAGSAVWAAVALSQRRVGVAMLPVAVYGAAAVAGASTIAQAPGVTVPVAGAAIAICHWGYGVGFWKGIGRIVSGRPFEARPSGHR